LFGANSWTTVTEELKDEETETWSKLMFYIGSTEKNEGMSYILLWLSVAVPLGLSQVIASR